MIEDVFKFVEVLLTLIIGVIAFVIFAGRCVKGGEPFDNNKDKGDNNGND